MKNQTTLKTIQLAVLVIIAAAGTALVFLDRDLFHEIANNMSVMVLSLLLWAVLILSFIFIYFDFSHLSSSKKELAEINYSLTADPLSGISNRYSCDMFIEQYADRPLPEGMACLTFTLTNLGDINKNFGHRSGNILIRDFSTILGSIIINDCFVGRNGGNLFLALFKECSDDVIERFTSELDRKIADHNSRESSIPIEYKCGIAFKEPEAATLTDLIIIGIRKLQS